MIGSFAEQCGDVFVVERVEREAAQAPVTHYIHLSQETKMMRNCRFGQAHDRGKIANAELVGGQSGDNTHPCWVAQRGKEGRKAVEIVRNRKRLLCSANRRQVNNAFFADRRLWFVQLCGSARPGHYDSFRYWLNNNSCVGGCRSDLVVERAAAGENQQIPNGRALLGHDVKFEVSMRRVTVWQR